MNITWQPDLLRVTIVRGCWLIIGVYSWIKPALIIPNSAINHTKQLILIISKALVIISSLLLPFHLHYSQINNDISLTPVIVVMDQSRSMTHNDLTPSRRNVAKLIVDRIYSTEISDTPFNGIGRGDNSRTLITYAHTPSIHKLNDLVTLQPITTQQGSSALGDAWLIAYDQISQYSGSIKPIVITITDGGTNTGYDLTQTATILKTDTQLWIIGISTGTQIVGYDDQGRGLMSTMDATLLSSLADSGHRYSIPDDGAITSVIDLLSQDLHAEYYKLGPTSYDFQLILLVLLGFGALGRGGIYLTKAIRL